MSSANQPTIVVIGAGVIGLSCALQIQALLSRHPYSATRTQVLLVAREWPTSIPGSPIIHSPNYASMWAGAHVRPIPAASGPQPRREAPWLKDTVTEFARLLHSDSSIGITRTPGVEFLEAPPSEYLRQTSESFTSETGLKDYRELDPSELPHGVQLGFEYETYCINSPLYCGNLLRKFILGGGKTLQLDLKSEWEAFAVPGFDTKLVINASGTGFGDWKSFPTRGQTVITNFTSATKTVTRQNKDGTWNFIIPRFFNGGTVMGGTKEPGSWQTTARSTTRDSLLVGGKNLAPYAVSAPMASFDETSLRVVTDVVGRRPTREGGMRIEVEEKQMTGLDGELGSGHVVHSYGAGGRGFEISWGVAQEVADIVESLLPGLVIPTKPRL